jgi:hypothetical protein
MAGAPHHGWSSPGDAGAVYLFYGKGTWSEWINANSADKSYQFDEPQLGGWDITSGDFNGDGYDDIAMGAPRTPSPEWRGVVRVETAVPVDFGKIVHREEYFGPPPPPIQPFEHPWMQFHNDPGKSGYMAATDQIIDRHEQPVLTAGNILTSPVAMNFRVIIGVEALSGVIPRLAAYDINTLNLAWEFGNPRGDNFVDPVIGSNTYVYAVGDGKYSGGMGGPMISKIHISTGYPDVEADWGRTTYIKQGLTLLPATFLGKCKGYSDKIIITMEQDNYVGIVALDDQLYNVWSKNPVLTSSPWTLTTPVILNGGNCRKILTIATNPAGPFLSKVYLVNEEDGTFVEFPDVLPGHVTATPSVDDRSGEKAYVGVEGQSGTSYIYEISQDKSVALKTIINNADFLSSIANHGEYLYLQAWHESTHSYDFLIINKDTGRIEWRHSYHSLTTVTTPLETSPAVANHYIYFLYPGMREPTQIEKPFILIVRTSFPYSIVEWKDLRIEFKAIGSPVIYGNEDDYYLFVGLQYGIPGPPAPSPLYKYDNRGG